MTPKVTAGQIKEIKRAIEAGESRRSIAGRLGLSWSTVARKVLAIQAAATVAPTSKASGPSSASTSSDAETLRAQIERLRLLSEMDLPPRDVAAVAGELRQSILALAKLERLRPSEHDVSREVAESAARVRARLEKIAAKVYQTPDHAAAADLEAPISATGTGGR